MRSHSYDDDQFGPTKRTLVDSKSAATAHTGGNAHVVLCSVQLLGDNGTGNSRGQLDG